MARFKKYENAKFSYWRSEERRRLLGIAGFEGLLAATTELVTDKVLQLIGQKHNTGCNKQQLLKEITLARKYIREISVENARKLKDFWNSFYLWKTSQWPNGLCLEDWNVIHHEDKAAYEE